MSFTVSVRDSTGEMKSVEVSEDSKVSEFKASVSDAFDIPADEIRLMAQGKVMKDDKVVREYGLKQESTVHLVRRSKPQSSTTSQSTSLFGPAPTQQPNSQQGNLSQSELMALAQTPFVQQLLSNPAMIRSALQEPEIMNNPQAAAFLRALQQNPGLFSQLAGSLGGRRGAPGSNPVPRAVFDLGIRVLNGAEVPSELPNIRFRGPPPNFSTNLGVQSSSMPSSSGGSAPREFISREEIRRVLSSILSSSSTSTNNEPQQQQQTQMETEDDSSSSSDPQSRFGPQLQQLAEMGFTDVQRCIQALEMANGDVNAALSFLM